MTLTFKVALVLLVLLAASGIAPAAAGDKTEVGIEFTLPDHKYTDEFSPAELRSLLEKARASIAADLEKRFSFLHFTAGTATDYKLTVSLARAEGAVGVGPAEFGLHFSLEGPEVHDDARGYVVFRTKDQDLTAIGTQDTLIDEIGGAIRRAAATELVGKVLKHIPIADTGELNADPLGWTIHRPRTKLCVDSDSVLIVENALPAQVGGWHEKFEARVLKVDRVDDAIVAMVADGNPKESVDKMKGALASVRVERVFVSVYMQYCPQPERKPTETDFSSARTLP
jgi:hypothetical protein